MRHIFDDSWELITAVDTDSFESAAASVGRSIDLEEPTNKRVGYVTLSDMKYGKKGDSYTYVIFRVSRKKRLHDGVSSVSRYFVSALEKEMQQS